jgi:hypothetical protein
MTEWTAAKLAEVLVERAAQRCEGCPVQEVCDYVGSNFCRQFVEMLAELNEGQGREHD